MTITITDDDIQSVFNELQSHADMPAHHAHCELCEWLKAFLLTEQSQTLAEIGGSPDDFVMRLFFLYCGIRIGRKQAQEEMLVDISIANQEKQPKIESLNNDITTIFDSLEQLENRIEWVIQRIEKLENKGEEDTQ